MSSVDQIQLSPSSWGRGVAHLTLIVRNKEQFKLSLEDRDLFGYRWTKQTGRNGDKSKVYWYRRECYKGIITRYWLHRVVMERILGRAVPADRVVDHIDRNPSNNTRENLREVTFRENLVNTGGTMKVLAEHSEHPYICAKRKKFRYEVKWMGKVYYGKCLPSREEASEALKAFFEKRRWVYPHIGRERLLVGPRPLPTITETLDWAGIR